MKNRFKNIDKRKFLGTVVGVILFSCVAFYFTYARYEWRSTDTDVTINFEDVMLEFANGGNVNVTNIGPVLNYTDGVKATFTATSIAGINFPFIVKLDITSISETLLVESFKYKLMRDTSGGTNYTEEVASGDFSGFAIGENIIYIETMAPSSTYSYQFIVYIDGSMPNDNNMQENSLVSTLIVTDDDAITDYSGNNNHAIQYGGTYTSDGLYLDGVDDYLMIKELDWNNTTAFTIDFIAKIEDSGAYAQILFESSENANENEGSFFIDTNEYGTNDLMLAVREATYGNIKLDDNIIDNNSFFSLYSNIRFNENL